MSEVEQSFVIRNELGLHARAATRFVQLASQFAAEVEVQRDGRWVNGKSIMGVLMLVAAKGTTITIRGRGDDAGEMVSALGELIGNKFGEE
jgi:phosphocarrier protein